MEAARLQLPAELTHAQARACAQTLSAQIAAASEVRLDVDASALVSFDSSALAVLLECRRAALAAGKSLAVAGLPAGLLSMARLYGVQTLLVPDGAVPAA